MAIIAGAATISQRRADNTWMERFISTNEVEARQHPVIREFPYHCLHTAIYIRANSEAFITHCRTIQISYPAGEILFITSRSHQFRSDVFADIMWCGGVVWVAAANIRLFKTLKRHFVPLCIHVKVRNNSIALQTYFTLGKHIGMLLRIIIAGVQHSGLLPPTLPFSSKPMVINTWSSGGLWLDHFQC